MTARPIGVLGGTFDPIHYGHLRPALESLQALDLAEIRFIPCRQPPHRGWPLATPEQRLAMLQLAIAEQPGFRIDERELDRDGPSYMVDTLTSLRAEIGNYPLCLMLGMDAFDGLPGWQRWQQIPELAHLVVLGRPGTDLPVRGVLGDLLKQRQTRDPALLGAQPAGRIWLQPATQLAIAATQIRDLCAQGNSPRYLLPDSVWKYIRDRGLYRSSS